MINVLIVDDHAIVRKGLRQILSELPDMVVGGEAENAYTALNELRKGSYSVAVLDLGMPGRSGLDLLKDIKAEWPKLPVLILSMYPEEQYVMRVLRAGASGFLSKESAPHELVGAIRRVAQGKKYVSPTAAEALALSLDAETERPPHELLSDREYQVLCMIAEGKRTGEIADLLALSVKTVSTYRTRIMEKLSLKTNADMTRYAMKYNLLTS